MKLKTLRKVPLAFVVNKTNSKFAANQQQVLEALRIVPCGDLPADSRVLAQTRPVNVFYTTPYMQSSVDCLHWLAEYIKH
jgi:hypothetical protein